MILVYEAGESFSGTKGLGGIEKNPIEIIIPEEFKGVKSFTQFKQEFSSRFPGKDEDQIHSATKWTLAFLNKLEYYLDGFDPIKYLYYLRFGESYVLNPQDITLRLKDKGLKISPSQLQKIFSQYFLWDLGIKGGNQNPNRNKKKTSPGGHGGLGDINAKKLDKVDQKVGELVLLVRDRFRDKIGDILNINEVNGKKIDKVTYILHRYGLIDNNKQQDLKIFLEKLVSEGYGTGIIANIINKLIKNLSGINLEVSLTNVNWWLK